MLERRKWRTTWICMIGLLALGVAGCGGSSSAPAATATVPVPVRVNSPHTLNWWADYGGTWPDSLDPAVGTGTEALNIMSMVHANLVKLDYPGLKVIGDLAQGWKVSDGGRVYTFTLRRTARFSNGDPVTASDVVWSIRRALNPATRSYLAMTHLSHLVGAEAFNSGRSTTLPGIRAEGTRSVRFTLDSPVAVFLTALAAPVADVLDQRVMTGKAVGTYLTDTCSGTVGAGPFKFVCRNNDSSLDSFYAGASPAINLVANPYYYGRKPRLSIHAPMFPSADAVFKAYQAGALDGAVLPPSDLASGLNVAGFIRVPEFETDYITPNVGLAPFNNVHCRLAVAYAIDRTSIDVRTLHGAEGPLYDMLPPGLPGYFGKEAGIPSYQPARAKHELAQCPGGLKHVNMVVQNTPDIVREYTSIGSQLRAVGAGITVTPISLQQWLRDTAENMSTKGQQVQMAENLWIADYPDASDWCSNQMLSTAPDNIGNFRNTQYDALVHRADVESNSSVRARLYAQAQRIPLKAGDWISVGYVNGLYVIPPKVHGLVARNGSVWPVGSDWSRVSLSGS